MIKILLIALIILLVFLVLYFCLYFQESFSEENQWVFIHVPKCGGTSIKQAIKKYNLPIDIFDHTIGMKNIPSYKKILVVYRDPIDRFASAFHYAQHVYQEGQQFTISSFIEALKNETNKNHQDALSILLNNNINDQQKIDNIKNHFTWVFEPQNSWYDKNKNIKVLMFENLQTEWDNFLKRSLKHSPILLEKKTQGKGKIIKAKHKNKVTLTSKEKSFLKNLYLKDYQL